MPVENRNGRHIGLSMKRADFMDGSRKNGSLSIKRADSINRDRMTRKKNEF
jgi:hypothetical protein